MSEKYQRHRAASGTPAALADCCTAWKGWSLPRELLSPPTSDAEPLHSLGQLSSFHCAPAVWSAGRDRRHGLRGPSLKPRGISLPLWCPGRLAPAPRRPYVDGRGGFVRVERAARHPLQDVSGSRGPCRSLAARIDAKAVFLRLESIWPPAGSQRLPTGQNAPVSQILTLAGHFHSVMNQSLISPTAGTVIAGLTREVERQRED